MTEFMYCIVRSVILFFCLKTVKSSLLFNSKIWYEAHRKPLANETWDTILVHFVQMLLNSAEKWSIKLVVLESLNKLLYMLFFVSFGNFSSFYIACLYTTIHVLYILPVICKNFNTHGLRIHHECRFFFLFIPR